MTFQVIHKMSESCRARENSQDLRRRLRQDLLNRWAISGIVIATATNHSVCSTQGAGSRRRKADPSFVLAVSRRSQRENLQGAQRRFSGSVHHGVSSCGSRHCHFSSHRSSLVRKKCAQKLQFMLGSLTFFFAYLTGCLIYLTL